MTLGVGISFTWLWLLIAVTFAVIETMTLGIVSIWFAIGALVAMLVAFLVDSFIIQLLVFLAVSLILVATTRKVAMDKLKIGRTKTNIDELIGKEAVVIKAIEPYMAGEVKLDGKIWRAVSESKRVYQVDEIVVVLRIEGVTIITK
ncbi:MAG: NfeD family protein [Turicibacter sp.]|nr:NfeD family protein [Turicibacter sp.]